MKIKKESLLPFINTVSLFIMLNFLITTVYLVFTESLWKLSKSSPKNPLDINVPYANIFLLSLLIYLLIVATKFALEHSFRQMTIENFTIISNMHLFFTNNQTKTNCKKTADIDFLKIDEKDFYLLMKIESSLERIIEKSRKTSLKKNSRLNKKIQKIINDLERGEIKKACLMAKKIETSLLKEKK